MALTYSSRITDPFSVANYDMSAIPQIEPPNMTVIPNSSKPDLLAQLIPRTAGPMTAYSKQTGAPMTVLPGTPLSEITPAKPKTTDVVGQPTTTDANLFDIGKYLTQDAKYYSVEMDKFRSKWGTTGDAKQDYERYLKISGYAEYGAAALQGVGAIADAYSYTKLRRDVEKTKTQYETQKKIIDTNIDNTEAALLENLRENMANLDVMTAAKNVDISSQAIVGDKVKGGMDLGEDIAQMRTNGALQKSMLDLEYAMNVRKAKEQEINAYLGAGLQLAQTAIALL